MRRGGSRWESSDFDGTPTGTGVNPPSFPLPGVAPTPPVETKGDTEVRRDVPEGPGRGGADPRWKVVFPARGRLGPGSGIGLARGVRVRQVVPAKNEVSRRRTIVSSLRGPHALEGDGQPDAPGPWSFPLLCFFRAFQNAARDGVSRPRPLCRGSRFLCSWKFDPRTAVVSRGMTSV